MHDIILLYYAYKGFFLKHVVAYITDYRSPTVPQVTRKQYRIHDHGTCTSRKSYNVYPSIA